MFARKVDPWTYAQDDGKYVFESPLYVEIKHTGIPRGATSEMLDNVSVAFYHGACTWPSANNS